MIKFYDILLTLLSPFVYLMGRVGLPHRKFTGHHYYKVRDEVKIGDVFLTRTDWEFSNLFNPSKLKHGAIYVGRIMGDDVCYVFESTAKGAILTDLVTFLLGKDVVVSTRMKTPLIQTSEVLPVAVLEFKGMRYDYLFNSDGKSFYCFELVAACIKRVYPHCNLKVREIMKGKKIFDHETFLDPEMFTIVFDTRKG